MKLLKRYTIVHESDLLYAKRDMSNFLKQEQFSDREYFTFALMELGTNLIKHAGGGEIWLLKQKSFLLAALDKGPGIKDIQWAKSKGTSSYPGSLGLGLAQLSRSEKYRFEIFSKEGYGTTILLHKEQLESVYFSLPLIENFNGDFFVRKGRYYLFGDASGHGIKANKSAQYIKDFFLNNSFSCTFIDEYFKELDGQIKKNHLRGAVLSIIEVTKKYITLCGVGNIDFFAQNTHHSFKEGVLGVAFSSSKKYRFERPINLYLKSDGVNIHFHRLHEIDSPYLAAVVAIFYANIPDDRSIFIIKDI